MIAYNSVLIIDDDPLQVAVLASYFQGLGVPDVMEATVAATALELLRVENGDVDLIVTDLQMPGMDGLEFMRHLRDMGFRGKLAIISGVKRELLGHASRLAQLHNLNLIGQLSKPLSRDAMDLLFVRNDKVETKKVERNHTGITVQEYESAVWKREIRPYYQPQVSVANGKVIGAESLVRWQTGNGNFIGPDVLLDFVEAHDLVENLTFHLFDRVLEDIPAFIRLSPNIKIAVNLAPSMITDQNLPDQLMKLVRQSAISPANLSFEVTENSILELDSTTLEVLSRLRINGFEVAIDDFGTGSSNIQTLRDFPYSELKIDRAFISNAVQNTFSRETVYAAAALAHDQGMKIVAEGVENRSTMDLIRDIGIEIAQGFMISRALPPEDFAAFLVENRNGFNLEAA